MKVTIKGAIYAIKYSWIEDIFYDFRTYESTNGTCVKVYDHEIAVDIPDNFDIRSGLVTNLQEEKKKLQAEFGKRVTEINAQIQSLLALEAS